MSDAQEVVGRIVTFDVPDGSFSHVQAHIRDQGCPPSVELSWRNGQGKLNGYILNGVNAERFIDAVHRLHAFQANAYVLGCIHHWGL